MVIFGRFCMDDSMLEGVMEVFTLCGAVLGLLSGFEVI